MSFNGRFSCIIQDVKHCFNVDVFNTALLTRMNSVTLIYLDFDQFIVTGSSELEKPLLIALSGEKEVV